MSTHALTADTLSAFAGILLSLVFSYVPKVKDWFTKQSGTTKRLILLASLAVIAAGALALNCNGLLPGAAQCTQAGAYDVAAAFIAALVANQAAYQLAPQN